MHPFRSVPALLTAVAALILSAPAQAGVSLSISVGIAPPPLPIYVQPPCPEDGYIWTPGYWAYGPDGYFWVPGTWVLAPEPGFFWTPCWWGWSDGVYVFHAGYWGPVVGFYGGINYGYGYGGRGYEGGYWNGNRFYYNRTVNNVAQVRVANVYSRPVVNAGGASRVSYNGGAGGTRFRPTAAEQRAGSQRHLSPTSAQSEHVDAAAGNRELRASENRGKPAIAATRRPGEFREAVPARAAGGPMGRAEARPAPRDAGRQSQPSRDRAEPRPSPQASRPAPRGDRMDRIEPRPEMRPQPRVEPRPEPRFEPRPEPRMAPRQEPRLEPRPEPRQERRPQERAPEREDRGR